MASCDDPRFPCAPSSPVGAGEDPQAVQPLRAHRRAYRRPELTQYGAVDALTRGGSVNMIADIVMMQMAV